MSDEAQFEEKNDLLHIIFDDGSFRSDLGPKMSRWNLSGFDYNMLAILGPQSSGKSTLLNGLFGTSFPTMVGQDGRYQCTKGIWMGKSAHSDTLVLDVEGTDGRERGEKEVAFEKKTSLFSLALSEILIVNMWMQDVGRNNAANLPLLKTVFEINLQLFQHEKRHRTLLLFVIRDHVAQVTPLEKLIATIENDLNEIWSGISKPDQYKASKVTDFFSFQYTSLPHKVLEADKFEAGLNALSARFNDASNADYIWSKEFKSSVPADGLPLFSEKVWEVIESNKDLDLPSQREILATFRCDEISATALDTFRVSLEEGLATTVRRKQVATNLGEEGDALMEVALSAYSETASRYLDSVVEKKREALEQAMLGALKDLWSVNTALLFERATLAFEEALQRTFRELSDTKKAASLDFGLTVTQLKKEGVAQLEQQLKLTVPSRADWSYSLTLEQLETAMENAVEHEKEKQLKRVMDEAMQAIETYGDAVTDLLKLGRPSLWSEIRRLYSEGADDLQKELKGKLESFGESSDAVAERLATIADKKVVVTRKRVAGQLDRVVQRMQKEFDDGFKMDGDLPRVWKPDSPLDSIYTAALDKGAAVLELYTVLRLEEADDSLKLLAGEDLVPADKMLMTRSKADSILSQYKALCAASCAEAQRAMANYGKASGTPTIMLVLILILGFNEFVWLLSNPFILLLLLCLAGGLYTVHSMGLTPVVLPVVNAAYQQANTQIAALINQATAPSSQKKSVADKKSKKE